MKVLCFGTYDMVKPRTRILIDALRESGVEVDEVHVDVWSGVEDKSQLRRWRDRSRRALRWLASYPRLLWRFLRSGSYDAIFVPYLGHLDVLVLWPFARIRNTPIVWDAFLSLWDTVVDDRRMLRRGHPVARLLRAMERLACAAADLVVVDTEAHAEFFRQAYAVPAHKIASIFVGVEAAHFPRLPPRNRQSGERLRVLFYGQFIPLHGIETIIEAACILRDEPIQWILVGRGQEEQKIRRLIGEDQGVPIQWEPWVAYARLTEELAKADVCLGIFGTSGKAARVIPNKVFQILSSGRPLITRNSPAMRELVDTAMPGVKLVPPGDAQALAEAVLFFAAGKGGSVPQEVCDRFSCDAIGRDFRAAIERTIQETAENGSRPA